MAKLLVLKLPSAIIDTDSGIIIPKMSKRWSMKWSLPIKSWGYLKRIY